MVKNGQSAQEDLMVRRQSWSFRVQIKKGSGFDEGLAVMFYADDLGNPTELFPWNPNGSPLGIAGLCSPCGRHTYTMPHAERLLRPHTGGWVPDHMRNFEASYYLRVFQNLREFAEEHQKND